MKLANETKNIIDRLPVWTAIRNEPSSIGAQFINVIGLLIEDTNHLIEYVRDNKIIDKIDIDQPSIVYVTNIPQNIKKYRYEFWDNDVKIKERGSIQEFLTQEYMTNIFGDRLIQDHFIVDGEYGYAYFKKPYQNLKLFLYSGNTKIDESKIELTTYHIWNFFDEIGFLLDLPRIHGENNAIYKSRLLKVFEHKSLSSKEKLIGSITNELGINTNLVSVHELHDKKDIILQNQLFTIDKQPTSVLQYYIEYIRNIAPEFWGDFVWNENFWKSDQDILRGKNIIPTLFDASIEGWR